MARKLSNKDFSRFDRGSRRAEAGARDFGGVTWPTLVSGAPPMFYARITGHNPASTGWSPRHKHSWIEVIPHKNDAGYMEWVDGTRKGTITTDPDGESNPAFVISNHSLIHDLPIAIDTLMGVEELATGSIVLMQAISSDDGAELYVAHDFQPDVWYGRLWRPNQFLDSTPRSLNSIIDHQTSPLLRSQALTDRSMWWLLAEGTYLFQVSLSLSPTTTTEYSSLEIYWTKEKLRTWNATDTNTGTELGIHKYAAVCSSASQNATLCLSDSIVIPVFAEDIDVSLNQFAAVRLFILGHHLGLLSDPIGTFTCTRISRHLRSAASMTDFGRV